ncbi:hypothetical protein ACMHYB_22740 [Sorangium sp. So ce1128]
MAGNNALSLPTRFDLCAGSLASSTPTRNAFGLVVQRSPELAIEDDSRVEGNAEGEWMLDQDLPILDVAPALP